ncbi:MAG: 50S ribosomal protein L11 methyltransferase [Clostridiales bacterium]|nr:50S ribosomal protein L11 methyltransferase [Clostridiales bacterium]
MEWIKYIVEVPGYEHIDVLYAVLLDFGLDSIEIESQEFMQLKQDEKAWDYCDTIEQEGNRIIFYLQKNDYGKQSEVKALLLECALKNNFTISIKEEIILEKDWSEVWKAYFKPIKITNRIVIKPEWENYEPSSDKEIIIEIDPGMAFGTGTHETTSMCIELLEKYLKDDMDVLDVGCGSGILSIAAAKLGAKNVTGVDIDLDAVSVSKENAEKNGLSDKIHIIHGDLTKDIDIKADIAVANILADIVIFLSDCIEKNLKGEKIFIASGIIREKERSVIDALVDHNFKILQVLQKGEWSAIAAQL